MTEGTSPPPQIRIRKEVSSTFKARLQGASEPTAQPVSAEATPTISKFQSNQNPHRQQLINGQMQPHHATVSLQGQPGNMQVMLRTNPYNLVQDSSKKLPSLGTDSKSRMQLNTGSPMQNDLLVNMK